MKSNKEMRRFIGHRKHSLMMKEWEKRGLFERLKKVRVWEISGHALLRMSEKNIEVTQDDILSTIHNSEIIEYKIDGKPKFETERVVLRSKAIINGKDNLNVVYDLTKESVISVWLNDVKDNHETLDISIYNHKMKVFL